MKRAEGGDTLNPRLYRLLKRRFRHVVISNQGEAAQMVYRRNPRHNNREEPEAVHPGEYYQVSCPYCHDTRNRLYINHLFGQRDGEGNSFLHLAHCFNENCLAVPGRVQDFIADLTELECNLERFRIREGKEVDISKINQDWPGEVIRLDKLPRDHRAIQYVSGKRGFDPDRLGKFYNVHYCEDSSRYWMATDRIIIPIYEEKRMVGWQARSLTDSNRRGAPPKYFTCPGTPRRMLIYNFANAKQYDTGVIVEGVTDVWAVGPMACCTLGATMTPHQRRKFIGAFKRKSAVLLWDPEEYEKPSTVELISEFKTAFDGGFAAVKLPEGTDPGKLDRQFLRDYIREQASAQGVKVSWRKSK